MNGEDSAVRIMDQCVKEYRNTRVPRGNREEARGAEAQEGGAAAEEGREQAEAGRGAREEGGRQSASITGRATEA